MRNRYRFLAAGTAVILSFSQILLPVAATQVSEPVVSSSLDNNWPAGPSVSSEAAILIEAETGTILYEKNMHTQEYPASITKILTCLIATELCSLDEMVTFTEETLATIPYDSSRIWVDKDEALSMEDCLGAILITSANDVAAGVAEHIGGTLENFADMMNERAAELGCLNSHFVNAHGYHDDDHYTTAYDMAQIARAFFSNELLCTLSSERVFHIYPSDTQPDEIWESSKNQLLATRTYEYEYLVGSKTGYTDKSRQTLVSCAQKDGMKLICVVMKAESPEQYKDTISLFDFGFSNFTTVNIYDNDKTYVTADSSYGVDVADVLGDSSPLLNMDKDAFIVLPKTAEFGDVTSYITMASEKENRIATANYQYGTHDIGSAQIYMTSVPVSSEENAGELEQIPETPTESEETASPIYINIKKILLVLAAVIVLFSAIKYGSRYLSARRYERNPNLARRRMRHRFYGIRSLFAAVADAIQGILSNFKHIGRSSQVRRRYKERKPLTSVEYTRMSDHHYTTKPRFTSVSDKTSADSREKKRTSPKTESGRTVSASKQAEARRSQTVDFDLKSKARSEARQNYYKVTNDTK